jgi:hypothetical protein
MRHAPAAVQAICHAINTLIRLNNPQRSGILKQVYAY